MSSDTTGMAGAEMSSTIYPPDSQTEHYSPLLVPHQTSLEHLINRGHPSRLQVHKCSQPPPFLGIDRKEASADPSGPRTRESSVVIDMPQPFRTGTSDYYLALKDWRSIDNIDRFLEQVYQYFHGKGLRVILLNRLASLLTLGFVVVFMVVLLYCVDWRFLHDPATAESHPRLWEVLQLSGLFKMSLIMWLCLLAFSALWVWQVLFLFHEFPLLKKMRRFYTSVLGISDGDLPACDFQDVIKKISKLQEEHPVSEDRLNAYDISNRIMRRENYLIALFNKEILDLSLPIPYFKDSSNLTKMLEWNLSFCILNYVFDENYSVRRGFLKDVQRDQLAYELRRRFIMMGWLNFVLAPFILVFMVVYTFFRYAEEIYKNPKTIGTRQYTPYARWKFREFNELPHYFDRRLTNSMMNATRYMEQFHSDELASVAKLIGFVAGSITAVLIIISIINEELLMHFEITPGRSVIWYIGFFGAIVAITRALTPDASQSCDPDKLMKEVAEYTHYMPSHWRNRLHSERVRREFGQFFEYRYSVFLQELLSVVSTPFVLWFSLPKCAPNIVEFFREFTVHVDGIGYVCSFALFDFERHQKP